MAKKKLIIVESPAKIKTLKKFLGPEYIFESSIGHIRDLPAKEFGIDLENDFEPTYQILPDKTDVIKKLISAAKKSDTVYLAPDPDREGEAIAWHIKESLPKDTNIKRVSFNSITRDEVVRSLLEPRDIDQSLVDAQQARRTLDRLVGYTISPILNRRIQRGRGSTVSAGRVQSVALKLVVDREKEIEAFKPVEYWTLGGIFKTEEEKRTFRANLFSVDGKKVEKEPIEGKDVTLISTKKTADEILARMKGQEYTVSRVEKKEKKRNPVPPFITSTLQQEASRHYGFSSARTMSVAQRLYEGIDLGNEGAEGLITYMRTDSVRVAPEALTAARKYIGENFGKEFLPEKARIYSSKKQAQDAHEAIRPTNLNHPPEKVKDYLTKEQFLLYQLVWRRFIASQMNPAVYDTVSADIITENGILLRATGSVIKFQGYLAAYEEKEDDDIPQDQDDIRLPNLTEGQKLELMDLASEQSFTRPPPRFTEASLVKELEKSGIGRPSTYATIMNKIQSRDYTVKEQGRLKPTELGRVIAELLEANFEKIMNVDFTAHMEDDLEHIAESRKDWKELVREFWKDFAPALEHAEKHAYVPKVQTELKCPQCKEGNLQKVWFRNKYFYGCSNYPDCNFSAPLEEISFDKSDYAANFNWEQKCPLCEAEMKVRHGRYGAFLGCSKYPDCRGIINIPKKGEEYIPIDQMPKCPALGCPGSLMARKSRFGKTFYSCSTFPDCDVIINNLDELQAKYPSHPRTPYKKKARKGAAKKTGKTTKKKTTTKRKQPTIKLSDEMAAFVGAEEMARGDVTKKVWEYIKANNLQDANDKRVINPDDALAKILGSKEPINMFKMTGQLSKHMKKQGD
ncbi:MAG: type I DNA topoisomerase [Chlamydiales bacterium]|nr:type I DNA topoisomerase [Chlamydiia bacterium]MCP5507866.1 type I DNA topoisomerase [Chlamydiales bacterium]